MLNVAKTNQLWLPLAAEPTANSGYIASMEAMATKLDVERLIMPSGCHAAWLR